MVSSADMLALLQRHYLPRPEQPSGVFAAEIAAPGASTRRADLIWQGLSAAGGRELIGHEIKTSRQDLRAELADPAKSDPWQRYCDRWYLVLPSMTLADGLELPPTWGVLTPPSGRRTRSMTVAVPAPELTPEEQTPAVRRLAGWLQQRLLTEQDQHAHTRRTVEQYRDELDQHRRVTSPSLAQRRVHQLAASLESAVGPIDTDTLTTGISVDDIVAAVTDLAHTREQTRLAEGQLHAARSQLQHLYSRIGHVLTSDLPAQSREAAS